jgi:hypothetical protein
VEDPAILKTLCSGNTRTQRAALGSCQQQRSFPRKQLRQRGLTALGNLFPGAKSTTPSVPPHWLRLSCGCEVPVWRVPAPTPALRSLSGTPSSRISDVLQGLVPEHLSGYRLWPVATGPALGQAQDSTDCSQLGQERATREERDDKGHGETGPRTTCPA